MKHEVWFLKHLCNFFHCYLLLINIYKMDEGHGWARGRRW